MNWSGYNSDLLVELARHNAPTLRTLKLCSIEAESISQLIQNVDGSYVQYAYLRVLKLGQLLNWDEEVQEQQSMP
ncbi:hypothetical protein H4R27_005918, partial [Coemansia aciculifera]